MVTIHAVLSFHPGGRFPADALRDKGKLPESVGNRFSDFSSSMFRSILWFVRHGGFCFIRTTEGFSLKGVWLTVSYLESRVQGAAKFLKVQGGGFVM